LKAHGGLGRTNQTNYRADSGLFATGSGPGNESDGVLIELEGPRGKMRIQRNGAVARPWVAYDG
jgi:hypothetical protein